MYFLSSHAGFKSLMVMHFLTFIKCSFDLLTKLVLIVLKCFCIYFFITQGTSGTPGGPGKPGPAGKRVSTISSFNITGILFRGQNNNKKNTLH